MTIGEQLAGAHHEWLASDEGKACANVATLRAGPEQAEFLSNRLWRAFMAGAQAGGDSADLRAMKQRLLALLTSLALVPPTNDFDRIAQAVCRWVLSGKSEVGAIVERLLATGVGLPVEQKAQR